MPIEIIPLTDDQTEIIDAKLEAYDTSHIHYKLDGSVSLGVIQNGTPIAGVNGCMTVYKIFYISTLFVDEPHRRQGIGRKLMQAIEEKAAVLGANLIRLDTFNWQGVEFYQALGYEQIGSYESAPDGFSEHFFIKRL